MESKHILFERGEIIMGEKLAAQLNITFSALVRTGLRNVLKQNILKQNEILPYIQTKWKGDIWS